MKIHYAVSAAEQLRELPVVIQERILRKIFWFSEQKDPLIFAKLLSGTQVYRFRIGTYRILFEIAGETLWILKILPRDKAYRGL